ncbi:hypothetical protein V8C86DRAFT_1624295 [Haematococcus lacustris]
MNSRPGLNVYNCSTRLSICFLITFTLAGPDLVQPSAGPHLPAAQVSKLPCHTFPLWVCCWEALCLLCGVPGLLSALMQAMPGALRPGASPTPAHGLLGLHDNPLWAVSIRTPHQPIDPVKLAGSLFLAAVGLWVGGVSSDVDALTVELSCRVPCLIYASFVGRPGQGRNSLLPPALPSLPKAE